MFSFITNLFKPKPKPIKKSRLLTMTKRELETLGRKHGIELDRRYLKDDLVEQLLETYEWKEIMYEYKCEIVKIVDVWTLLMSILIWVSVLDS